MASILAASKAEYVIARCEAGILEPCDGSTPLDLLARGMVEKHTGDLETAKDLLSRAYWQLEGEWKDKAGVQLAYAYWLGGEKDESQALLDTLPASFDSLLMLAIIQAETDPNVALQTLERMRNYDVSRYKWGRLHNLRGICYRRLGQNQQAGEEYQAALYFFGDSPLKSQVETNWSYAVEDRNDAHEKLDRAIESLEGPCLAQAYDLKARTFLLQGDYERAQQYADWSVGLLEATGHRAWLAESLTTQAEISVKLLKLNDALSHLSRVVDIADYLNDRDMKFKAVKQLHVLCGQMSKEYHVRSVDLALSMSTSLSAAARMLGTSRPALQDFMRVHNVKFKSRARKSLITK